MGKVYQGAYLSIAASQAFDYCEGFLTYRNPPTSMLRVFTCGGRSKNIYLQLQRSLNNLYDLLDARAWTLQERYLSRRQLRLLENKIL